MIQNNAALSADPTSTTASPGSVGGSNDLLFEFRFKPNARILDARGEWASTLAREFQLSEWQIVDNRVDVFSPDRSVRAFVSFRNAGFQVLDSPTANYFPDKANKFVRLLFNLAEFGKDVVVERLGVRSRFCTPYQGDFSTLLNLIAAKYAGPTSGALDAIGKDARIVDIGAPLNFADHLGNFNSSVGPMTSAQFSQALSKKRDYPAVGLFYDIDYWLRPNKAYGDRDVSQKVSGFSAASWDRHERIRELILGS